MKKIMFNDKYGLTKAVLKGMKTMTRRIATNEEVFWPIYGDTPPPCKSGFVSLVDGTIEIARSKYAVGEVVAVAQSYKDTGNYPESYIIDEFHPNIEFEAGWNNKMFVRADLMIHQVRITDVRVERLQDITDEDCLKEGVFLGQFHTYSYVGRPRCPFGTPREAFASLIDRISGKGTWESNPWVFVYEFELLK